MDRCLGLSVSNHEVFSSQNTQKKNFPSPNGSQTHYLPEYWLHALTTELLCLYTFFCFFIFSLLPRAN